MWHWQQWYLAFMFSSSLIIYIGCIIGYCVMDMGEKTLQMFMSVMFLALSWYALYSYGFWN